MCDNKMNVVNTCFSFIISCSFHVALLYYMKVYSSALDIKFNHTNMPAFIGIIYPCFKYSNCPKLIYLALLIFHIACGNSNYIHALMFYDIM